MLRLFKGHDYVPPYFFKIPEIKSISKPPLPIEIYTICQNLSLDNFRKEVSRLERNFARHPDFEEVSGAGELPPCALSEPDLNLSAHPAPIIQPLVLPQTALPSSQVPPIKWLTSESGWITHPLRSRHVTALHRYYGVVRPCVPLRYSHSCGSST